MSGAKDKLYGWHLALGKVDYQKTLDWQHGLLQMRQQGFARDTIITVEHPPVITVGKDGHEENYANLSPAPIKIERGGDVTYHGPGQLVVYFIFNLTRRGRDLHKFMDDIQEGIIRTLAGFEIEASRGTENTGVWVQEKKIASIGVAVKKWMSFHGAALNLNTKLSDFEQIHPCGLSPEVMTSTEKLLGKKLELADVAKRIVEHYCTVFDTNFMPIDLETLAEDVESQEGSNAI